MPTAVAQSLIPSAAQAPLDSRMIVDALADIPDVENPYIGLEIYCVATGKKYRVKTLSLVAVGTRAVYVVDTYEVIPDAADLGGLAQRMATMESHTVSAADFNVALSSKADIGALAALDERVGTLESTMGRVASLENTIGTFETQARAILGEEVSAE